jgi:branched-chain amino acid transport system permease protein
MLAATVVGGISLGFLYGLIALTLILLVRTTGVLNFAAADVGMLSAFIAFAAMTQLQVPVAAAMALTAAFALALGASIYCGIVLLRPADPLMLSLRTLGLLIIVRALAYKVWGANSPYTFPPIVPGGGMVILGLNVSFTQIAIIALALTVALAVGWLTSATRIGLMLRAVSSDRQTAADLGVAVVRVDLVAWCMAALVAGIVGILVAQLTFLSPDMMSPILLAGFAAAQLGDMQSMRIALIAGVALGIVQSLSSVYLNQPEWSQVLSFAVLAGGLLLRGQLRRTVVVT